MPSNLSILLTNPSSRSHHGWNKFWYIVHTKYLLSHAFIDVASSVMQAMLQLLVTLERPHNSKFSIVTTTLIKPYFMPERSSTIYTLYTITFTGVNPMNKREAGHGVHFMV